MNTYTDALSHKAWQAHQPTGTNRLTLCYFLPASLGPYIKSIAIHALPERYVFAHINNADWLGMA